MIFTLVEYSVRMYYFYNAYALVKDLVPEKGKPLNLGRIRKSYRVSISVTKKAINKKMSEGCEVQFQRDTRCGYPTRIEIVLNDMLECVVVKFIAEHNHLLSATPSKSKMHLSHSTAHRYNFVHRLVQSLNSEGIGLGVGPNKTSP